MTLREFLKLHGYDGEEVLDHELATRHRNGLVISGHIELDVIACFEITITAPARTNRDGQPVVPEE